MNKVILMGRLTKDPEIRTTQNNLPVCSFILAVDRRGKKDDADQQADFIACTAWRQTAEFIARYFGKGQRVAVVGSIQTSHWDDQDGKRHYRTDVMVQEVYFADSKIESHPKTPNDDQGKSAYAPEPARKRMQPTLNDLTHGDPEMVLPFDLGPTLVSPFDRDGGTA